MSRRIAGHPGIASIVVLVVVLASEPANAFAQGQPAAPGAAAFQQGVQLHDAGKYAEAIPLFKQAIEQGYQPVNMARFRLARAYVRSGQTDQALTELETLAAAGFAVTAILAVNDLDAIRSSSRFKAFEAKVNANAHPCAADSRFHSFDFWVGEWDVQPTGSNRGPLGSGSTSIVERQLEGCVIQENWLPLGGVGSGKSFNIFNTTTGKWEQYYVDSRGTITHYFGTFHADGNLYYEADQFGTTNRVRMTFFNQGPSQVRQLGEVSTDGGKTWGVTYDLTYVRKK